MESVEYLLRAKSLSSTCPPVSDRPEYRLFGFTLTAERRGKDLGGNNIQAVVGAPAERPTWRSESEEEIALLLSSGWWVSLRNQFAKQPEIGTTIVRSAADRLGAITSRLTDASGAEALTITRELFDASSPAIGPDFWR